MNKKGVILLYINFIILTVTIIFITAFFAPMGVKLNTEIYASAEKIILSANDSLSNIQNQSIRNELNAVFASGLDNAQNNIEVNNAIFKYGWVILVLLTGIIMFIFSRSLVELQGGRGLI